VLAAQGRVDGRRCVISGGRAGGYTTLAELLRRERHRRARRATQRRAPSGGIVTGHFLYRRRDDGPPGAERLRSRVSRSAHLNACLRFLSWVTEVRRIFRRTSPGTRGGATAVPEDAPLV
jgi:hypothetical protein